ncbi:hypothetical protein SCHPADRAFT_610385 [Schizopora paradoxa]|uniref:BTB domain-containing protein n=1 Tax=Schizopora paradoxa TaxID=27342 RepID=A0A0H2RU67_9AGAM|nr:hypothetical protein SCHPADRAFT_610385 [Schizopora paradoxa]
MDVDRHHGEPSNGPKPHDFLWFPDGNVVLATDTFLFKVHKSLLAVHSSVFRDMFELPNVGHGDPVPEHDNIGISQELYEGVPMIRLTGDKGEEVAHLLRAVFEPNYYRRDDNSTPLEVIVSLLLLSTKYDFNVVRKDIVLQISRQYPMDLHEYEALDNDFESLFGRNRLGCHFPLLSAALTAEVHVLLPCLYFACSDFSIEEIFLRTNSMSREDLRTLMVGRELLDNEVNAFIISLPERLRLSEPRIRCQNACLENAFFVNLNTFAHTNFENFTGRTIVKSCLFGSVCNWCHSALTRIIDDKREEIWNAIPSLFKFREWDVLEGELRDIVKS